MQICDMVLPSECFNLVGETLIQKNEVIRCVKGYERKGHGEPVAGDLVTSMGQGRLPSECALGS